jgi:hypothetical protein
VVAHGYNPRLLERLRKEDHFELRNWRHNKTLSQKRKEKKEVKIRAGGLGYIAL